MNELDQIDFVGFEVSPNMMAITCHHVLEGRPINLVSHDDDGDFQFLCSNAAHETAEGRIICISHMIERLAVEGFSVNFLPHGKIAWKPPAGEWVVEDRQPDDERE